MTFNMEEKLPIKSKRHKKRKSRTQGISDKRGAVEQGADQLQSLQTAIVTPREKR